MGKLYIKRNYGQTPVELLNNKNVSMKSKGMYAFIQSKPDMWSFSAKRISNQIKEGISTVNSCLQELEREGYLERVKVKNEKGHWDIDYILHENPVVKNPTLENPATENPVTENYANNSNIDYSKKDYSNKHNSSAKKSKDFSDEVIRCYNKLIQYFPEELIPKNNKSWLETIDKLNRIDNHSFDTIEYVVKKTRGDNFWKKNFLSLNKLRLKNKEGVQNFLVFKSKFGSKNKDWKDNPNSVPTSIHDIMKG